MSSELKVDQSVDLPCARGSTGRRRIISFTGFQPEEDHVALALGPIAVERPLVRIHSECLTGDVFGSLRCDCGPQLDEAIERISHHGGYILYLRQEGRGIGLAAKIRAYALQDRGLDTYEANRALGFPEDLRDFSVAGLMLRALGAQRLTLLTNNPDKAAALVRAGLDVDVAPTRTHATEHNGRYLAAKSLRAHALSVDSR